MKMQLTPLSREVRSRSGSIVLILIVLLGIMAIYLVSNTRVLNNLQRELNLIEKRQLDKFPKPPGTNEIANGTNSIGRVPATGKPGR
jgi:hypothetical protein